jgi:hypothetical protein
MSLAATTTVPARPHVRLRRRAEGAATGLAYACALVVVGAFVVASFRPEELGVPYWERLRWLRTDTLGVICFFVATLAYAASEYLRLSRGGERRSGTTDAAPPDAVHLAITVVALACAAAGTALVVYLSVNAATHPETLLFPATHLLPWPSEGTLRAVALIVVAGAVATARTQRISRVGRSAA